jgi:ABC-type phosphate transport system substrate-binding protein
VRACALAVCVASFALMPPALAQPAGPIAVVVHPDVPVDNVTVAELRRLVLGDREFWPGGLRVTLLIRAPVARERDVVLKTLCEMSEAQFRQHWIGKVFRADTALAPKIVYSTSMALDLAASTPGAIAFVEAAQVERRLKVLRIDGKLPADKGYPLQ